MSDNRRPPGYVSLTIHELASGGKGRRGSGLEYVYSQDARGMDDSVLGSSAAKAVTSGGRPSNGGGRPYHGPNAGQGNDGMPGNNGGRRRNRRNNNNRNNNNRRGRGDGPMFGGREGGDGEQEWNNNGNTNAGVSDENFSGPQHSQQNGGNGGAYAEESSGFDEE